MKWHDEAMALYKANVKINDIADKLQLSRKTVSKYINSLGGEGKAERKKEAEKKRRIGKRKWAANARLESHFLKRQHEIDVRVLSSERFFNEY